MVQRGPATIVVIDEESSYGTPKSSNKTGVRFPFISCAPAGDLRELEDSAELRNNFNTAKPTVGPMNPALNLSVALRSNLFGKLLKFAVGAPTTTETPIAAALGGSDIKGTVETITIAGGSGAYTLNTALAGLAVGDRIIYTVNGARTIGYVTTDTDDDEGVLETTRAGGTPAGNVTAAPVVAIMDNLLSATPGTVSISSGTATFSEAQSNLAVGQMIIYLDTIEKYAWVTAKTSSTVCTVVDATGKAPGDVSGKAVQWLGIASYWTHVFKRATTTALASFVLDLGFGDLTEFDQYKGGGVNTMALSTSATGQGEVVANFGLMFADFANSGTAYDSAAVERAGTKFMMKHAAVKIGGVQSQIVRDFTLNLSNDLDPDLRALYNGGVRSGLPQGLGPVNGSFVAHFANDDLLDIADGETETSLELQFNYSDSEFVKFLLPEVVLAAARPGAAGVRGVTMEHNFTSYYEDATEATQIQVTLQNQIGGY
jgi:hypothetical protein